MPFEPGVRRDGTRDRDLRRRSCVRPSETDPAGALVREYRRAVAPLCIPHQLRDDSLAALDARLDSVPVDFSEVKGMPPNSRHLGRSASFAGSQRWSTSTAWGASNASL